MAIKRVAHIVNWYPHKLYEGEAIWTKRHIDALRKHCKNDIFHIAVKEGKWKIHKEKQNQFNSWVIVSPVKYWFLKEIMHTVLLSYVIVFKMRVRKYDVFNFQITYPALTYAKWIRRLLRKKPIIITEHWSAYHLNFGVKNSPNRIKRIFRHHFLKFILVSEALQEDIENFSDYNIKAEIVPNIVHPSFKYLNNKRSDNSFLMVSLWKYPKDPLLILQVFKKISFDGYKFSLRIGGFGPMSQDIKDFIKTENLEHSIKFIGRLSADEINEELNDTKYFVHCSEYEVASVICMESVSAGTPALATAVGGIVEYIDDENGKLVAENTFEYWYEVIRDSIVSKRNYDYSMISKRALARFGEEEVGKKYYEALEKLSSENDTES